MKKTLLSLLLTGIIAVSSSIAVNAAGVTFTKPTVTVNTSQEENAVQKAKSDIEKAKTDAQAKQAQKEKEAKAKQAERQQSANQVKQNAKNTADSFKNLLK